MIDEKDLPEDPHKAHDVLIHKINEHTEKMHLLDEKLDDVISENRTQNEKLDEIAQNTAGLVEVFRASSGALKVFKWLGIAVGWIGGLASAIYAIVYAIFNWPQNGG